MDLIAQGRITSNFIAPTFNLLDTFNSYWSSLMPAGAKTFMAYSLFRFRMSSICVGEILSENN
jgi:hypothetical protein